MSRSRQLGAAARFRTVLWFLVALASLLLVADVPAQSSAKPGDRFGVRGGIWPHKDIEGSFGERRFFKGSFDSLDARISEDATIAPFVEIYGLFHLKNQLWLEASAGWAGRTDIQVGGFNATDSILLGSGRVDFFPLFAGIRYSHELGSPGHPHNIYARAGGSLVFANESPDLIQDSVSAYGIYSPGTEGAFGFLAGVGGEFYFTRGFGVLLDVNYRYTRFNYAEDAKFNLSNLWLGLGATLRTR